MYLFVWGETLNDPDGKLVCNEDGFLTCLERALCELIETTCYEDVYGALYNSGFITVQDLGISQHKFDKYFGTDELSENAFLLVKEGLIRGIENYINFNRQQFSIPEIRYEVEKTLHQCLEISEVEFVDPNQ